MARFRWFTLTRALKCVSTIALISVSPAHAQRDAAHHSEAVAEDEIEQRMKLDVLMARRTERDDVIKEIIDERDKIKEARKSGVDLTSAKIHGAFTEMSA